MQCRPDTREGISKSGKNKVISRYKVDFLCNMKRTSSGEQSCILVCLKSHFEGVYIMCVCCSFTARKGLNILIYWIIVRVLSSSRPQALEGVYVVDDSSTPAIPTICDGPKDFTWAGNYGTLLQLLFSQASTKVADPRLAMDSYPRIRWPKRLFVFRMPFLFWKLNCKSEPYFQIDPARSCFGKWKVEYSSLSTLSLP